jgi:hypothetical protein
MNYIHWSELAFPSPTLPVLFFPSLCSAWLGFARCNPRRAKGHRNAQSKANKQSVAIGSKK